MFLSNIFRDPISSGYGDMLEAELAAAAAGFKLDYSFEGPNRIPVERRTPISAEAADKIMVRLRTELCLLEYYPT